MSAAAAVFVTAGASHFEWTPALATATPEVAVFLRTSAGWRQLGSTEFAVNIEAGVIKLDFPYVPPAAPAVGSLRVVATDADALAAVPATPAPFVGGIGNLAGLLGGTQNFLAGQMPATITIAGQDCACATSGLKGDRDLISGGWLEKPRISFWLPASAFADAGQPLPAVRSFLTFRGVIYLIINIPPDPTGQTVHLLCTSPDAG